MHNVVEWPNTLLKKRFLKYVWPFYNIMHERVNLTFSYFLLNTTRTRQLSIKLSSVTIAKFRGNDKDITVYVQLPKVILTICQRILFKKFGELSIDRMYIQYFKKKVRNFQKLK